MALDGTLKSWTDGEPVIPDGSHTALKYWNNGEPYVMYTGKLSSYHDLNGLGGLGQQTFNRMD